MLHAHRYARSCTAAMLTMLVIGCGPNNPADQAKEKSTAAGPLNSTSVPGDQKSPEQILRQARIAALTFNLDSAQAQHTELALRQSKVTALLESHQTEGAATLANLKAEMKARQKRDAQAATTSAPSSQQGLPTADRFPEQARDQLEQALAMDREYQTQLAEVNGELSQLEVSIDAMRAELKSLQAMQTEPKEQK